jgi:hypothetical protein
MTGAEKREAINEYADASEQDLMLADGFDDAILGIGQQFNREAVVYDWHRCVQVLMDRDGASYEEAVEWMDYNVTGAYVGEATPIFVRRPWE